MERRGYYLKGGKRPTIPGVLFTMVQQVMLRSVKSDSYANERILSRVGMCVTRRRNGKWTKCQTAIASTGDSVREWMMSRADKHRVNWVIAPIASDFLTLTGYWNYVESRKLSWGPGGDDSQAADSSLGNGTDIVLQRVVLRGIPDILDVRDSGIRWRFVSGHQYLSAGPAAGSEDGTGGSTGNPSDADHSHGWIGNAAEHARRWSEAFKEIFIWWQRKATVNFGMTLGQLAVGLLRTYSKKGELCSHKHSLAHSLERESAYGGRASCFYVGPIVREPGSDVLHPLEAREGIPRQEFGPLTLLDVRSMYPYLLREMEYPYKFITYTEEPRTYDCVELARSFGVIARVSISTRIPEYPCRDKGRVIYPVGRFTTTLTGPELLELVKHGEIHKCHAMTLYHKGRVFARVADVLLCSRTEIQSATAVYLKPFVKQISNSLGGKLAQTRGQWTRDTAKDGTYKWGETHDVDVGTGRVIRRRFLCGICWRWEHDKTGSGPFTFAFSYLAAYGRLMMRKLRECCPPRSVVSQDTDGIWVLPEALSALENPGIDTGDDPGQLRFVESAQEARFYGPRHYCVDGSWVLSGFHNPQMDKDGIHVWDTVDNTIWNSKPLSAPTTTTFRYRKSALSVGVEDGIVGDDGWVTPISLPRPAIDKRVYAERDQP